MPKPTQSLPTLPPSSNVVSSTRIASLWSNYGYITRLTLASEPSSLILKSIHPPPLDSELPDESHLRKLLSYDVERWFYAHLATRVPPEVKLARAYPLESDAEHSLLLEDLAREFAYPARGSLGKEGAECVLRWLAGFHAAFFGIHIRRGGEGEGEVYLVPPPLKWTRGGRTDGVWERGTYWYLDTRRDELAETDTEEYGWLLPWVEKVNDTTRREIARYGTLVHGDAKGANIVFNRDPYVHRRGKVAHTPATDAPTLRCALYDLQYVGLGLPAHDLVYFLGTSVESGLLTPASEETLLRVHYDAFVQAVPGGREAYPWTAFVTHWELAIVDWYRFMAGWGFWGNDRWAGRRAKEIVKKWEENCTEL